MQPLKRQSLKIIFQPGTPGRKINVCSLLFRAPHKNTNYTQTIISIKQLPSKLAIF